jgi:hypothetical protein
MSEYSQCPLCGASIRGIMEVDITHVGIDSATQQPIGWSTRDGTEAFTLHCDGEFEQHTWTEIVKAYEEINSPL